MARDGLALAFGRLHSVIIKSQAAAVLEALRPCSTHPKPDVQALLQVFAAISSAQGRFGEAERALLAAYGLEAVVDTAWWAVLITACTRSTMDQDTASMIDGIHARLQVAADTFPALAKLMDAPATGPSLQPGGIVLLLPGIGGAPPALARVVGAIEALNQLWTVAEDLTGQREALHLVHTEPGPTMALHFDGMAEPLQELRALLASIWEQMARLATMPAEQHAVLVPEMLPVMQRIGQSGRSDALRVRAAVEEGVRRLLGAGCILPAATTHAAGVPRPNLAAKPGIVSGLPGPAATPLSAAAWGRPPALDARAQDDAGHLAAVIAEERSQLKVEPARRLWQDATTTQLA